jgi:hypothetical protein
MKLSQFVAATQERTAGGVVMPEDVGPALQNKGWKVYQKGLKSHKKHSTKVVGVWTKSFSGVAIEAILHDYTFSLDLSLSPTFAVMKRIQPDPLKFLEEPEPEGLNVSVDLTRKLDVAAIEREAKSVASVAKMLMKPRKKPTHENYEYGGKTGEDALKQWTVDAEDIIIKELKSSKQYDTIPQIPGGSLTRNILHNYGRNPGFSSDKAAYTKVLALLRKLKKKGLVSEHKQGAKTLWEWEGPL